MGWLLRSVQVSMLSARLMDALDEVGRAARGKPKEAGKNRNAWRGVFSHGSN